MMNALGSAGLLNSIVNVISCKVKKRIAYRRAECIIYLLSAYDFLRESLF